jgi:hypothetical protein
MGISTRTFGVRDDALERLRAAGLDRFEAFMSGPVGVPFKRKSSLEIFQLAMPGGSVFYLKRSLPRAIGGVWREVLRGLRRGERAHTEAFHARLAARVLGEVGVEAMPIAAWGEERFLGVWPRRGFVLADGVGATEVFRTAPGPERERLLRAIGDLLGCLHANGLFVSLRLHDLIVASSVGGVGGGPRLVMIDLDFKGHRLRVGEFNGAASVRALAHCQYLFLRGGDRLTQGDARAIVRGYRTALGRRAVKLPARLARQVRESLRRELAAHHADAGKRRMFPQTPESA